MKKKKPSGQVLITPLDVAKLAAVLSHEYVVGFANNSKNVRDSPQTRIHAGFELLDESFKHAAARQASREAKKPAG